MALVEETQRIDKCTDFPDFAVCCLFIEKFGDLLGLLKLNVNNLQKGFEDESDEVPDLISELHIYLLRRLKRNVPVDRWEKQLVQFCTTYSNWHAWELEDQGYVGLKLSTKLAIIRNLLEAQFDGNLRFQERLKAEIPEEELRSQCYGRDKDGLCYWLVEDEDLTINVYRVEQDDTDGSSWQVVSNNRDELVILIECLKENKPIPGLLNSTVDSRSATPLSMMSTATSTVKSYCPTPSKLVISTSASDLQGFNTEQKVDTESNGNKEASVDDRSCVKLEENGAYSNQQVPAGGEQKTKTESVDSSAVKSEPAGPQTNGEPEMHMETESLVQKPFTEYEPVKSAKNCQQVSASPNDQSESLVNPDSQSSNSPDGQSNDNTKENFDQPDNVEAVPEGNVEPEEMVTNQMQSGTDSEDNIPLSQLKHTCVLLHQAKKSLMKAKKQHEKRKLKEMAKKKQDKLKSKNSKSTASVTNSPSTVRSSARQRRPVFQQLDSACIGQALDGDSSDFILSDDDDYVPKGRNARRQAKRSGFVLAPTSVEDVVEDELMDNDDTPCNSCGKYTQPHLILLCDKCDAGWHTACVKPALFYIPEGDWHCPNCEHAMLVEKLESHLVKLDAAIKSMEAKQKRIDRQMKHSLHHGINLENIIEPESDVERKRTNRDKKSRHLDEYEYDSWEEDYGYTMSKRSSRQRSKVSYRFEEYENMIDSAIKGSESDPTILRGTNSRLLPPAGQSRGKDISNLLGDAGVTVSSDEDEEEEEEESLQKKPVASKGEDVKHKPAAKKRRRHKLNDIDAGSDSDAAEPDTDYSVSDDGEALRDEEELSEGSTSEEDWVPGSSRRRGSCRSRRNRDDIRSFICDDDDEEEETYNKSKRNRKPPANRLTRTSAAAAQEAIRSKRKTFGFSSDESLASTPGSSSSEEEVDFTTRRKNKWNTATTYSSRKAANKKSKNKPKKKRRRITDYNSEQSTDQDGNAGSDDDYIPLSVQQEAEVTEDAQNKHSEGGNDESEEEGHRRVNNRLESSTDEETDVGEDNCEQDADDSGTAVPGGDNTKQKSDSSELAPEESNLKPEESIKPSNPLSVETSTSASVTSQVETETESSGNAKFQDVKSTQPVPISPVQFEPARPESAPSGPVLSESTPSVPADITKTNSSNPIKPKTQQTQLEGDECSPIRPAKKQSNEKKKASGKPEGGAQPKSPKGAAVAVNNRLPLPSDPTHQPTVLPYNPNMSNIRHPMLIQPGHSGSMPHGHHFASPPHVYQQQQGQPPANYNHFSYNSYRPPHMQAGDGHYVTPGGSPLRGPPNQQHFNNDSSRFPHRPQAWHPGYSIPPTIYNQQYQPQTPPSQPPATVSNQNSSSFMMDNIIERSGEDSATTKTTLPTAAVTEEEEEDEMSSYMTMASFVTSKSSS